MLRPVLHYVVAAGMAASLLSGMAGHLLPAQAASAPPNSLLEPELTPAQYWPDLNVPDAPRQVSVKLKGAHDGARLSSVTNDLGGWMERTNEVTGVHTVNIAAGADAEAFAKTLAQDPRVEWAEPVRWRRLAAQPLALVTPNDPRYKDQKWYYDVISAPDAWSVTTGSPSIVIAVVDSGVMCGHPELQANIWANPKEIPGNGVDDDGNGFVDDVNGYDFVGAETGNEASPDLPGDSDPCVKAGDSSDGNGIDDDGDGTTDAGVSHGTFVSGVAAGIGNNGAGIAGMCWFCKIMPVRVANPEGWVRSSDTADGVTYAARNGAKVINLSLGGPQISNAESAAVDAAANTFGAVVVAAAGNENHTPISFPARLASVIAVGASGHASTKGRAVFSNWGTGAQGNRLVDVVAPGVDIVSTSVLSVADQNSGVGPAGSASYSAGAGTSFSSPMVAGLVGLILSRNSSLTPAQVRQVLDSNATPLGDDPGDNPNAGSAWAGSGMINAFASVSAVTPSTVTPTPTLSPTPGAGTPTPTPKPGTPTATPRPGTPLPPGSTPQPVTPPTGAALSDLGTALVWNVATGATQYQIQVLPANNDGPSINLIRDIDTSYAVPAPLFGTGPYVMLPGMTYSWRIRTTTATVSVEESSPLWGAWSPASTFKTRSPSGKTISVVQPSDQVMITTLMPILQWSDNDKAMFYYELQLSKDPSFNTNPATATAMVYTPLLHGGMSVPPDSYKVPANAPLEPGTQYFWRVRQRVQGDGAPTDWSTTFRFRTP